MRNSGFDDPEIYELDKLQYFELLLSSSDDEDEVKEGLQFHKECLESGYPIQLRYEEISDDEFLVEVQVGSRVRKMQGADESEFSDYLLSIRSQNDSLDEELYFGGRLRSSPWSYFRSILS